MHKGLHAILVPDCYNIESARTICELLLLDISFCRFPDQLLFRRCYRLFRGAEFRISAHLYFNEHDLVVVARDDVDLAMVEYVISIEDRITLIFQKGYGKSLPLIPDVPPRRLPRGFHSHFKNLVRIKKKISKRKITIGIARREASNPSFEEMLVAR